MIVLLCLRHDCNFILFQNQANDIALLKLKKAMNISNYDAVDKIEIHKNCSFDDFLFSNINKGGQVTAIGWSLLPLLSKYFAPNFLQVLILIKLKSLHFRFRTY